MEAVIVGVILILIGVVGMSILGKANESSNSGLKEQYYSMLNQYKENKNSVNKLELLELGRKYYYTMQITHEVGDVESRIKNDIDAFS